jgi:hypothetical protein
MERSLAMKTRIALLVLLSAGSAVHADLTKVDRTIKKEPAYQGKPQYCLLVFGEDRTRVWLILDGDTLHVERDGELEKISLPEMEAVKDLPIAALREVEIGSVREGTLTHTQLTLMQFRVRKDFIPKKSYEKDFARALGDDKGGDFVLILVSVDGGKRGRFTVLQRPRRTPRSFTSTAPGRWACAALPRSFSATRRPTSRPV